MKNRFLSLAIIALLTLGLRVAPASADIDIDNVSSLDLAWEIPTGQVTAAPIIANGLLYVASWDKMIYALDPEDGSEVWSFDAGGILGSQTTVLPLANGDVCFGSSAPSVTCLNGTTGAVVWGPKMIGIPFIDSIWSGLAEANGRLFVSVASLSDNPCTNGRLIALSTATGDELWTHQTVPDFVCQTDTSVECTTNGDCPASGECVQARGAGVTATVSLDPSGNSVYMNTVGCFTFPSVGDSDTVFKLDAATGDTIWKNRVNEPEQFGFCADDPSEDCGQDAHCTTGVCTIPKGFYHDFGFLNGPIPVDVPDAGRGGTKTILVSGSKNGTLYAFNEDDGQFAWTNAVLPTPITPGFAGFGLFNAPLTVVDTTIYAAMGSLIPKRVCEDDHTVGCNADTDCLTGVCVAVPEHLAAFDATDGSMIWSDEIGESWSGTGVTNGVLYVGTNDTDPQTNESWLYAYNAATGERLQTFTLPNTTVTKALSAGDFLYTGYGVLGPPGGFRAYKAICRNPPAVGCLEGARANLSIQSRPSGKNRLHWKLVKGDAFTQNDVGAPNLNTDYAVCVYDQVGDVSSVAASVPARSDPNAWEDKGAKGFLYKDKERRQGRLAKVKIEPGEDGKTKVEVVARGSNVLLPPAAGQDRFFLQDSEVIVQLRSNDTNTCWSSTFTTAKKNNADEFKAKAR